MDQRPQSPVSDGVPEQSFRANLKHKAGDAANRWFERNRSLVLRQTPVWAQSMIGIVISLGTITVFASIFFRIDEVVTVSGQLKSIGGTFEVETPAGGRVEEVFFSNGDFVKKGDLLARFDTRQAAEQKATLTRLIDLERKQLQSQLDTYSSQEKTLLSRREVLNQSLKTKSMISNEMKSLVDQGGFQKLQYLQQLDQIFELENSIKDIEEQRSRLVLQRDQLQLQSEKSIDRMSNQLQAAERQLSYQIVQSQVDGVVFDVNVSPNGVLQPGERLLSIVPKSGLYAEVFVPNRDIGFIKLGQDAKVRVDAFPFTRYGEIQSSVSYISADALDPEPNFDYYRYPVNLKLSSNSLFLKGSQIPLKPGMSITTNLKLRDKRVISLVSDLLVDQTDSIKSIRQQ